MTQSGLPHICKAHLYQGIVTAEKSPASLTEAAWSYKVQFIDFIEIEVLGDFSDKLVIKRKPKDDVLIDFVWGVEECLQGKVTTVLIIPL